MAQFSGRPSEFTRMLGLVDEDDPTNLPPGLAALARNIQWELTSARTRDGFNTGIFGLNKSPITGLMGCAYTPESNAAGDTYFQLPLLFDMMGTLQAEFIVGSGKTAAIPSLLLTLPENSHMIGAQAYNNAYLAFSDLTQPTSQMGVYNLKTNKFDPYGLKPFGWVWQPGQKVVVGEICTPSVFGGNGHTYRCTQSGTTSVFAADEPNWPLTEGATVNDGTAIWKELTMVLANRIPAPAAPVMTRDPGAGAFPASKDVYALITYVNGVGETIASVPSVIANTVLNDAVTVAVPLLTALAGWIQGLAAPYAITAAKIYVADVAHGSPAPAISSYNLVGTTVPLGSNTTVTALPGVTSAPPTTCTARVTPGQLPIPVVAPALTRVSGTGFFPAGQDVYTLITYVNAAGETTPGPSNAILNTVLDDAVQATIPALAGYEVTAIRLYEADVPTGSPAPDPSEFALVGSYQPGAEPSITATATGVPPPTSNTTGAGGSIAADSPTAGPNNTQGYRYASVLFLNRNFSWSGFTQQSVVQYDVDENGWELAAFNVPTGPSNVIGRAVIFSNADATNAGPFWWIGKIAKRASDQLFIYPQTQNSAGLAMTSTLFYDNVRTSGTFNFTEAYLEAANDATSRLRVIWPNACVDIFYSKSTDRMFQCGVPGYYSSCWVSLAGDPESYYGDTGFITVGNDDGQRSWCVREFQGTIYLLRERSGYVISPTPADPALWSAQERWPDVGPCGPRAVDVCGEFMIFVHRSGIYRYDASGFPEMAGKEVPKLWSTINWAAAQTICCRIDREQHVVHILVPTGASTVPNQEIVISYLEGWNNPIHFSTYSGKEISMDAARRYGVNDMAAYVCGRIERVIPAGVQAYFTFDDQGNAIPGPTNLPQNIGTQGAPQLTPDFFVSQFAYGSSGQDGTVQVITPGIFNDNGQGIDSQYETVCEQQMMALCKLEGFNLNARGQGPLQVSFLAGREMVTDWNPAGEPQKSRELKVRPVDLVPNQSVGISRNTPAKLNERWRARFTNGKQKDCWFEIKYLAIYTIPMFSGRAASEG